jgi:hypothetical protein
MLPARTRLVENEAFAALKQALELEAFRYLQHRGHHRLPYKQYVRAHELGIDLPEAQPTYTVGLLGHSDPPDPVEVVMPKDFPLAKCYRLDPSSEGGNESDEANVHLLAALGTFDSPFVPVDIQPRSEIWYHFGGWSDEGDTYDTQEFDFEQEFNRFWADVVGPDEHLRQSILSSLASIKPAWKWVTISSGGTVTIRHANGSSKTIKPPSKA